MPLWQRKPKVTTRERNTIPGCVPPGESKGHADVYEPRADAYIQAIKDYCARVIDERVLWRKLSERKLKRQ